jgi:hypothetical protein
MDARLADAGCFIGNRHIEAMLLFVSEATLAEVPKWVVYPEQEWRTVTPAEAGISDADAICCRRFVCTSGTSPLS